MTKLPEQLKTSDSSLWEEEYRNGGIPSSVRNRPSNVVVDFRAFVKEHAPEARTVIDLGCGTGRNSLYLASEGFDVTAVDYVRSQVDQIAERTRAKGWNVVPIWHDIGKPWPFPNDSFDVAIDCFCFKHQINATAVENYIGELWKTLKGGGYYLLFLAAKEDGYYKQFLAQNQK